MTEIPVKREDLEEWNWWFEEHCQECFCRPEHCMVYRIKATMAEYLKKEDGK